MEEGGAGGGGAEGSPTVTTVGSEAMPGCGTGARSGVGAADPFRGAAQARQAPPAGRAAR